MKQLLWILLLGLIAWGGQEVEVQNEAPTRQTISVVDGLERWGKVMVEQSLMLPTLTPNISRTITSIRTASSLRMADERLKRNAPIKSEGHLQPLPSSRPGLRFQGGFYRFGAATQHRTTLTVGQLCRLII